MKQLSLTFFIFFSFIFCFFYIGAQNNIMPHLQKQGSATQLIVQGNPFLMLGGELHNSSTSSAAFMLPIWQQMKDKNLNTVIAATSWELIEKEQGKFDFTLIDSIVSGARDKGLHLIIIWFGSWKNGGSTYMPSWVKKDFTKYPRVKNSLNKTLEILSPFSDATCNADAAAFKAMMKHIRLIDEKEQTVIMVQVENEVGVLNATRDFSEAANKEFIAPVPKELLAYLLKNKDNLSPALNAVWKANGSKLKGNWESIFGKGFYDKNADWKTPFFYTEELFMAYQYAQYIGKIAAAGKQEYALPMFVNAWQKQPDGAYPGKYPSGGPLPNVMDMWRAGAPAIDMIVPDIYIPQFKWVCEQYHTLGNPLLIPETRGGALGAARAFYAFSAHDAMCFSAFGIDGDYLVDNELKEGYAVLDQLKQLILKNQGTGNIKGVLLDTSDQVQNITLGGYKIEIKLQTWPVKNLLAGAIIINTAPDEFIVSGKGFDVLFIPIMPAYLPLAAIDFVDEGTFKDGVWTKGRRLNGDETHTSTFSGNGLKFPLPNYSIQHVKLYRYK